MTNPTTTAEDITGKREHTHGDWRKQAFLSQTLKGYVEDTTNWPDLSFGQREALEMICVKLSRILTGDPNEHDHWLDIMGYADLGRRSCDP